MTTYTVNNNVIPSTAIAAATVTLAAAPAATVGSLMMDAVVAAKVSLSVGLCVRAAALIIAAEHLDMVNAETAASAMRLIGEGFDAAADVDFTI